MTNRYSCFDNMFPKLEKNEYFEAENLPVGIKELNNFFASDTICRFGCSTSLPLLKKTNSILLERYKKNILNQNKNLNVENISRQFPGKTVSRLNYLSQTLKVWILLIQCKFYELHSLLSLDFYCFYSSVGFQHWVLFHITLNWKVLPTFTK